MKNYKVIERTEENITIWAAGEHRDPELALESYLEAFPSQEGMAGIIAVVELTGDRIDDFDAIVETAQLLNHEYEQKQSAPTGVTIH